MKIDANKAKSLCTADEFKMYEQSRTPQLSKLTVVQLKELVVRSRTARDKWRDVARTQRRSSQSVKGHRDSDENARSKEKQLLFTEIHQTFVDRLAAVEAGSVSVPRGKKEQVVHRADRKVVHRVERAITKKQLKGVKRAINKKAKSSEQITEDQVASTHGQVTKTASNAKQTSKSANKSKKQSAKKASAKTSKTTPVVTKARKRRLAKIEAAELTQAARSVKKADRTPKAQTLKQSTKSQKIAVKANVSRTNVINSGSTKVKSHISSAGKRSQARRDSK
ncbi:MAG TPA: hypothetical protein PKD64_11430 [Pirellulaceae bacterium]|nr:hypothetical protein [Pirellulaceae bacterium]HMO92794.1 hypothetical protein [Pirellulaceae bacterium]HMP69376.1 hypothetical protein [Pirellulaceae bacterium]